MKILIITNYYPMPERASGYFRFYQILKILSQSGHELVFFACDRKHQNDQFGAFNVGRYIQDIQRLGIVIAQDGFIDLLKCQKFDVIFFEFYFVAHHFLNKARFWQPQAKIIIDTVDVWFHRLFSKAYVTQRIDDYKSAQKTMNAELEMYKKADVVIAVSENDKNILLDHIQELPCHIVPNIHPVSIPKDNRKVGNTLLFVGGFQHDPNVDAVIYFCNNIWPTIEKEVNNIQLKIIGDSPPQIIKKLARENIEILGYTADIVPHLENSYISIAPLRYGAGMKGKIGEALSYGLPVVTTSIGIEGFGLIPEEHVLLGDTPEEFAKAVIRLLKDKELYQKMSVNGKSFIQNRYSEEIVSKQIGNLFENINKFPTKKLSKAIYAKEKVAYYFNEYLAWRFNIARHRRR